MEIKTEVVEWLLENAYAVKNKDIWFLPDFPSEEIPDRLHIPVSEKMWEVFKEQSGVTPP